jgi:starch-binding outer membrane protein, SusD/RagB family
MVGSFLLTISKYLKKMKKKYINLSVIITALMLTSTGCNDDFLERYPLDQISNETFWNTENDLAVYNNNLYTMTIDNDNVPILMGHSTGNNLQSIWFQDNFSDNYAPLFGNAAYQLNVRTGLLVVPGSASSQTFGYRGWDFVRAINVGLENYNKAKVTQAIKNRYIGEARLFRGWFYAEKVTRFGDVPYLEKPLNIDSPELFDARTPRLEVMDKVLLDLNAAVDGLPASWGDGGAPGRLNRWAALLVKSRVCLFEGTFRKYHKLPDPEKWLTEAANAAKELIEKGPYALHSTGNPNADYSNYHRLADLAGNREVIYWKKYVNGVLNNNVERTIHRTIGGATKSFIEDYLCKDGLPISLSPLYKGDKTIEDVFVDRDPRLRQTILLPSDNNAAILNWDVTRTYPRITGMAGGNTSTTGYHVVKFFNPVIGPAFNTGITPAIVMRLGEALLNYAEAQAELGKITQADLDLTINRLRTRVGMPALRLDRVPVDPRYTSEGISPLLVEIRRERRIELIGEGFRYNDLLRWKQGRKLAQPTLGMQFDAAARTRYAGATVQTTVDAASGKTYIDVYKGSAVANPVFDESKNYLWPIPLGNLAQNPNIKQNPGW